MLRLQCASCSADVPEDARFCASCGTPVSSVSQMPTGLATPSQAEAARRGTGVSVGRLSPGPHAGEGFAPGAVFAERYRIIGLIGRGGMGEVYRADDLKLGQAVALKFLPEGLAADRTWIERFYAEVRHARQVSHPNVCRVYDVGELAGRHYLSMEYVDGEDLASLLRRIGRLPPDKAVEIARQLCAGLAAAHERGVLHRDLKPANVMIDGQGRARITDFGLAVAAEEQIAEGEIAGTPAYMAPEQLAGRPATVQSDIYALGLVLYELFAGKKAFEAASLAEWRRKHAHEPPPAPSQVLREIDPVVERVILRCLEKEPAQRPRSALSVAAALPGGDPLAAALAAGETPSPEMVAAAGAAGAMKPAAAWICLVVVVGCAIAAALLSPRTSIHGMTGVEISPQTLADRSREILRRLGYTDRPRDRAYGFRRHLDYVRWVEERDRSPRRWADMADGRPAGIFFWYRQAPSDLVPRIVFDQGGPQYSVNEFEPPSAGPMMIGLRLDPHGRLIRLEAVPYPPATPGAAGPADWSALFREAGLEEARFRRTESSWIPPRYAEERASWMEIAPERPDRPFRIEAAAYRGRPVYFELLGPWNVAPQGGPPPPSRQQRWQQAIGVTLFIIAVTVGAVMARSNLRRGKGDRRGAVRVAVFIFFALTLGWIFGGTHVFAPVEIQLALVATALALFFASLAWLLYLAVEPMIRRSWPDALISWTRLLGGRVTDPRVGRDLLVSAAAGAALAVGQKLAYLLRTVVEATPPPPVLAWVAPLMGTRFVVSDLVSFPAQSFLFGIGVTLLVLLLRRVLRRDWLAGAVIVALVSVPAYLDGGWVGLAFGALNGLIHILILIRLGFLALVATDVFTDNLRAMITTDPSLWYFGSSLLLVLLVVGVAVFAFRSALAGKPAFGTLKLEE